MQYQEPKAESRMMIGVHVYMVHVYLSSSSILPSLREKDVFFFLFNDSTTFEYMPMGVPICLLKMYTWAW